MSSGHEEALLPTGGLDWVASRGRFVQPLDAQLAATNLAVRGSGRVNRDRSQVATPKLTVLASVLRSGSQPAEQRGHAGDGARAVPQRPQSARRCEPDEPPATVVHRKSPVTRAFSVAGLQADLVLDDHLFGRCSTARAAHPAPRRAASTEPASPCTGRVWLAIASPRCWWALTPPFHPYPERLRRVFRPRRFPFCATFHRLSPSGISPASCPAVSGLSFGPARSRPAVTRPARPIVAPLFGRSRLGALSHREQDGPGRAQDELAAHRAPPRLTPHERDELLVERAVERRPRQSAEDPTTLPRISTCRA